MRSFDNLVGGTGFISPIHLGKKPQKVKSWKVIGQTFCLWQLR